MIAPTPNTPQSHACSASPAPPPDVEQLGDEIAELSAHLDAAMYRLLVRLAEFDRLEGWGGGFRSCAHWLSWRTSIGLGAAREKVRVARALPELPRLSAAMERGEISFSQARAITRIATRESEERLLEFATHATAMQLEALVRAWRQVDRLEAEQVRHERRRLSVYADADGSYVIRGRLDPEVGELFERALDAARAALYRPGGSEDVVPELETTPAQRRADALGLVAEWALGSSVGVAGEPEHAEAGAGRAVKAAGAGTVEDAADAGAVECELKDEGDKDEAFAAGEAADDELRTVESAHGTGPGGVQETDEAANGAKGGKRSETEERVSGAADAEKSQESQDSQDMQDAQDRDPNEAQESGESPDVQNAQDRQESWGSREWQESQNMQDAQDPQDAHRVDEKGEGWSAAKSTPSAATDAGDGMEAEDGTEVRGGVREDRPGTAHRADRFLVVLHVDGQALQEPSADRASARGPGAAVLEGSGLGVSAETARRLACDAGRVIMTHGADGSVLDVGRKSRTIPPAIRRALEHRDRGCRFPGCGLKICDAHHIRHWAEGGETRLENLTLACRRHHRALHEGGFRVEVTEAGELRFYRPDGQLIPDVPPPRRLGEDPVGRLKGEHRRLGLVLGPWTATPKWTGERLDLGYAVCVLRPRRRQ